MAVLVVRAVVRDDGGADDTGAGVTTSTTAADDEDDDDEPGVVTTAAGADADAGRASAGLAAAALRLSDLPSGWTEASDTSGIELCPEADPLSEVPPRAAHDVAFAGGASGPFLASTVAEFRDAARAEAFLRAAAEAIEACAEYEGEGGSYELERFTVRGLGEESLAARMTGRVAAGEVGGPIYYAREGRRVVSVAALAIGAPADDALARRAVEAVLDRL